MKRTVLTLVLSAMGLVSCGKGKSSVEQKMEVRSDAYLSCSANTPGAPAYEVVVGGQGSGFALLDSGYIAYHSHQTFADKTSATLAILPPGMPDASARDLLMDANELRKVAHSISTKTIALNQKVEITAEYGNVSLAMVCSVLPGKIPQ